MKAAFATLVVAACILTACAAGQGQRPAGESLRQSQQDPWQLPQHEEFPLETDRAAEDFAGQLARLCFSEIYRQYPDGLPFDLPANVATERCAREKIAAVASDPVGDKVCQDIAEFHQFMLCQLQGAFLTQFRKRAGGPKSLSEAEWRDSDLAKENLISEYVAQAYMSCTEGDRSAIETCQVQNFLSSLGLPKDDIDYCLMRGSYAISCLSDKAVAGFLRDMARRLWE